MRENPEEGELDPAVDDDRMRSLQTVQRLTRLHQCLVVLVQPLPREVAPPPIDCSCFEFAAMITVFFCDLKAGLYGRRILLAAPIYCRI